MKVNDWK